MRKTAAPDNRSLDKKEYLMIFLRLIKMIQMRGHNICLYAELIKIIPNYHQILSLT